MKPEEGENLLFRASMVLLAASNVVGQANTSSGGDEELAAIDDVLLTAHFYANERMRSRREPFLQMTVLQAEKLAARRQNLAKSLRAAAELLELNAKDRLEATLEAIREQQPTDEGRGTCSLQRNLGLSYTAAPF